MPSGAGSATALKAELRRAVLARREAIPAERRAALSEAIFQRVVALEAFRDARTVLAYWAFGSEPATPPFLQAVLACGKTLALPRVRREARTLELHRVTNPAVELRPGAWGIREPDPAACRTVALGAVDFILVPGVGFDLRGGRIGYGAGYYDRLLPGVGQAVALVAAAFEAQLVDEVPAELHDRPVDRIVTEQRVIDCAPRRPAPDPCPSGPSGASRNTRTTLWNSGSE